MSEPSSQRSISLPAILGLAGTYLCVGLCCAFSMLLARFMPDSPNPQAGCVQGVAGEPAIFKNGQTTLFRFPESASNIENKCLTFQGASIWVWFEMDASELDALIESMRWELPPLTTSSEAPTFGNPLPNATYQFSEFNDYPEGVSLWVDTTSIPHRIYIYIWLD